MLNKLGYGPDEYSLKRIKELGLKDYLEEQVNPNDAVDDIFNQKIQKLSYPIDYEQYGTGGSKKNIKENRPYTLLNASLKELWPLYQDS
ncbi:hypothetical protein ABTD78_19955, partial [Acinetobacter baumannii]